MLVHVSTFWVPKRGCSESDYEDATWVAPSGKSEGQLDLRSLRVNLADGASESLLARRWAQSLVRSFGAEDNAARTEVAFMTAYEAAVNGWPDEVRTYQAERQERHSPIQWFEEPGLAKGAYSTLVAFKLAGPVDGASSSWAAACIGDSCVFHVRDGDLCASFPLDNPAAFSYQTPLLASKPSDIDSVRKNILFFEASWQQGDSFYPATDALAAWFLTAVESGQRPWEILRDLDTRDAELDFREWVETLRDSADLRDDDTTLVRIDT